MDPVLEGLQTGVELAGLIVIVGGLLWRVWFRLTRH